MQTLRASAVAIPFVAFAVLVYVLSLLVSSAR